MQITPEVEALVRRFMAEEIPFNRFLGVEVDAVAHEYARISVPFREELIGDPLRRALHGGVLSMLLDTVGGAAVWTTVGLTGRVSTIDLRVDYLRPGRCERLIAEARVLRVGNRVGVVSMRAFHPDAPEATVADGRGVYNIKRGKEG